MDHDPHIIRVDFTKRKIPLLKELLSDQEVGDFYRFVYDEGMRVDAIDRIELELSQTGVVLPFHHE
ncbi:MAG: hypothetical protein HYR96_16300 [Deltaproteobacteria bacterium]|nr:hypothetical protein [Deltaproteobacteria bacterium]MBI3295260.1 hypothetical protein [Deltaproteobacteria bacterium]